MKDNAVRKSVVIAGALGLAFSLSACATTGKQLTANDSCMDVQNFNLLVVSGGSAKFNEACASHALLSAMAKSEDPVKAAIALETMRRKGYINQADYTAAYNGLQTHGPVECKMVTQAGNTTTYSCGAPTPKSNPKRVP